MLCSVLVYCAGSHPGASFRFVQEEVALPGTAHFTLGGKQLPPIALKLLAQQIEFDCHHAQLALHNSESCAQRLRFVGKDEDGGGIA
jgi:hypothetical protein